MAQKIRKRLRLIGGLDLLNLVQIGGVRRRMPYDTWYHVHLMTYAAVFLTFLTRLVAGASV